MRSGSASFKACAGRATIEPSVTKKSAASGLTLDWTAPHSIRGTQRTSYVAAPPPTERFEQGHQSESVCHCTIEWMPDGGLLGARGGLQKNRGANDASADAIARRVSLSVFFKWLWQSIKLSYELWVTLGHVIIFVPRHKS